MLVRARQGLAVAAASCALAYVSIASVTEVQRFAAWPVDPKWHFVCAFICGVLLTLISDAAVGLMFLASVLSILIYIGVSGYLFWRFFGEYFGLFELITGNLFISVVLPRSMVMFFPSILLGIVGVLITMFVVPDHYRP
jgi:hypothetical protein